MYFCVLQVLYCREIFLYVTFFLLSEFRIVSKTTVQILVPEKCVCKTVHYLLFQEFVSSPLLDLKHSNYTKRN